MSFTEQLIKEASRCLNCPTKPCMMACPARNPIPEFMQKIKAGALSEADDLWHKTSNLPELCGLLCPQETLCEGSCTLNRIGKPLKIGYLETEIAKLFPGKVRYPEIKNGRMHLVIGLGPAGMANAMRMAELGYDVTAIEADRQMGGAIYHSVPDFRFDDHELAIYEQRFDRLGITVNYHTTVGRDVLLADLIDLYDSIFIAHGLDIPVPVEIEHDDLVVYYAIDLLQKRKYSAEHLQKILGHKVGIIGLGFVAIDMARTLIRLGKDVEIIYRRVMAEAPASMKEIEAAKAEGVKINELYGPVRFFKQETAKILDCERTCLIHDSSSSRSRIAVVPGEAGQFELDDLIFATGQMSSDLVLKGSGVRIGADCGGCGTNNAKIFVGGDRVNRDKRIVDAMVSGIRVADLIASRK